MSKPSKHYVFPVFWLITAVTASVFCSAILAGYLGKSVQARNDVSVDLSAFQPDTRLSLSQPTSRAVDKAGFVDVLIETGGINPGPITVAVRYDPALLRFHNPQALTENCPSISDIAVDHEEGIARFSCPQPAISTDQKTVIGRFFYTPLATGTATIRIDKDASRVNRNFVSDATVLRQTSDVLFTIR